MYKNNFFPYFLSILLILGLTSGTAQKTNSPTPDPLFMSKLKADAQFPLFTTYAAAAERSDFVLDEGYEFRYYIDSLAPDFITDNGVDLGIAFKLGDELVYRVEDMYLPPVITVSYPDMVEFVCFPFNNIRAEGTFLVYSSQIAILDWKMTNLSSLDVELELFQYVRNQHQLPYSEVKHLVADNVIQFQQEVIPDGWTVEHEIPFADSIVNYWLPGFVPDKIASFESFSGENTTLGFHYDLTQPKTRQINGRIMLPGRERMVRFPPVGRLQLYVNGNNDSLLTEQSLIWGERSTLLDQHGYYHLEAGLLDKNAKSFRVSAYDLVSGKAGASSGVFNGKNSERADIELNDLIPPPVTNLRLDFESEAIIFLTWEAPRPGLTYSVYRKYHGRDNMIFTKIADGLERPFFKNILKEKKAFDYIVVAVDSNNIQGIHSGVISTTTESRFDFAQYAMGIDSMPGWQSDIEPVHVLAAYKNIGIKAGKTFNLRSARVVQAFGEAAHESLNDLYHLLAVDLASFKTENEARYRAVKPAPFPHPDQEALFWSAANMMRQCFYRPEGKSGFPYYVFSREPTWGWGHGGQVFHESLTMIAYAKIDPQMAMQSQRVFEERQYENGYINYRTGSYLDEKIESNGDLTTSAPWYAWTNWEVYQVTKDKKFLQDMYQSSKRLYEFITTNRDKDHDGLCEWGGDAVLESVRDALVAVWDQVGDPTQFEALDLNCMLVKEAKSLEAMALELGLPEEANQWKTDYQHRSKLINLTFWDKETGFYYQVDKKDHDFTLKKTNDLKRQEIIGFLPLWAGICDKEQAGQLVRHLTDTTTFWRLYGIPSLSAGDPYFQPKGYWNGPVWVEWNFLIHHGLLDYGFTKEAAELSGKVARGMIAVLRDTHNLWEFYSPDQPWGGHHKTYIWAGLINEMMQGK